MALIGLTGACLSTAARAADFRFSEWGDSSEAVRRAETAELHHRSAEELAFTDHGIDGIDGGILYLFERDRLVTGIYVSRESYPEGAGVLEDYEALRAHLERRLGRAGEESRRWIGEEGGGDPRHPEAAVAAGRLRVATEWSLERTHVALIMTGSESGGVFLRAVFKPAS